MPLRCFFAFSFALFRYLFDFFYMPLIFLIFTLSRFFSPPFFAADAASAPPADDTPDAALLPLMLFLRHFRRRCRLIG